MINSGRAILYQSIGIAVSLTHYEIAGEYIRRTLNGSPVTSETYARRHFIVNGIFKVAFPELPEEIDHIPAGGVWPPVTERNTNIFTTTALENDSRYICVMPRGGGLIKSEQLTIAAGNSLDIAQGCILIPINPCQIGEVARNVNDVVVLQNSGATITADQDIKVWRFWNNRFDT